MDQKDREYLFTSGLDDEDSVVGSVIELLSRKWTRAIIEVLLAEDGRRYNELNDEIDGISDKVLSDSLKRLESFHLVRREVVDDRPVQVKYWLTEPGASLEEVVDAVVNWTENYQQHLDSETDA
ncbi:winged helix-turn-helix transcriptional regulator [Haladaptatus sp. CMAA 1911]|uniref:winged helix-turn-helix transcriptional regulator n=1 Tax=unclassified Haladaptatus TaxID=2622732 RepID=UPI00375534A4